MNVRRLCGVGAISALLVCLGACSTGNSGPTEPGASVVNRPVAQGPSQVTAPGDPPQFTGPWAQEFADAWSQTTDPVARQILSDGNITDAEMAELQQSYVQCLENLGFSDIVIGRAGQMSFTAPDGVTGSDAVDALQKQCGDSTGWEVVGPLNSFVRGNPDHIDPNVIMAQCLVRVGLKPEGYTGDDYKAEFESNALPEPSPGTADWQKWVACNTDPAHAT